MMITKFSYLTDEELEQEFENYVDVLATGDNRDSNEAQVCQEVLNRMPDWIQYNY